MWRGKTPSIIIATVPQSLTGLKIGRGHLDKARQIAELRSPARDDGTIARILWKIACVMEDDPAIGLYAAEAAQLRNRAEIARRTLTGRGEGEVLISIDKDGNADEGDEEAAYDALVPMYFQ